MSESRKNIAQIAEEDGRYDPRALKFVFEGLGVTIQRLQEREGGDPNEPRHISGQDLALGLAELATERWGRLARLVLGRWGVHTTRDLGEIVYLMIRHQWMTSQPEDRIEDFDDVFDFETMFEKRFDFEL